MIHRFSLFTLILLALICFSYNLEGAKKSKKSTNKKENAGKRVKNNKKGSMPEGLITPRDNDGMYLLTSTGEQIEVNWNEDTKVAIDINWRVFNVNDNALNIDIHSSSQVLKIELPKKQMRGVSPNKVLDSKISVPGMRFYYDEAPISGTTGDVVFEKTKKGSTKHIVIDGEKVNFSLQGQTNVLVYDVWGIKDVKPFINKAKIIGKKEGDIWIAKEIHLQPIGDQVALDDPNLPRYLFIGDSISGNYGAGLRSALKGKFNIHHPPTNCGPSSNGRANILNWLGAYKEKGRHWDVISFNFGHWDATRASKFEYQNNLEYIISELKKTGAQLIWVTTCPVPSGYPKAGELVEKKDGKPGAPGRTHLVMEKYLNPWALEVMNKHPEISVCDQWQYVKDNENSIYKDWWKGKNVHFNGQPADKIGEYLAKHVEETYKK